MKMSKNMNEVAPKARSESAMVAASNSSHVISKSYCAAKDEGRKSSKYSKHKIITIPTLRIVHVYEPETIITDPQNFRSLVQKLTGKPSHKSKEKKRQTNRSGPLSVVASAKVGTGNESTLYSNGHMPIMENETNKFSIEESSGYSKAFNDTDMIVPGLVSQGLLHENPPVCDNVQHHFSSNNWIPIMEKTNTVFSFENCSGCSEAFNDTGIIFSCLSNRELLQENPLVWNSTPF